MRMAETSWARQGRRFHWCLAVVGAIAVSVVVQPAIAGSCLEQVRQLGDYYHLRIDPPDATGQAMPNERSSGTGAQSGGVLEPPSTSDRSVIEPPAMPGSRMPTLPDVTPGRGDNEEKGAGDLSASDLSVLQSILVAARAESERGDERDCFARLGDAKKFIQRETR